MSTFGLIYLGSLLLSLIFGGIILWWERKIEPDSSITLAEALGGLFMVVCPIVNTLVAVGTFIFCVGEISPKITIMGPKK